MNTRRAIGLLPLLLLIAALCACGGPGYETVSPEDMREQLLAACNKAEALDTVLSGDENAADAFAAVSDLNPAVAESFFLAYAKDGKNDADEIAVILVKNEAAVPDVTASLETHLEGRKKLYAASAPQQKEKLDSAEIFTEGRYVVLLVSDDNEALKTAFRSAVEK